MAAPGLLERVAESFEPIYGKPCWNVQRGYGSFLTLEIGEPHLVVREPMEPGRSDSPRVRQLLARRLVTVRGEWHLWFYCCRWSVTQHGEPAGGSTSLRKMDRAAWELNGQALVRVSADLDRGRWFFDFDLGGRLETRPYGRRPDPADEQWHLYEPSGNVLTVRADGAYSYHPGNTTRRSEDWVLPVEGTRAR